MKTDIELIIDLQTRFGNSNELSRKAVIDAHGGIENLKHMEVTWAQENHVSGTGENIVVAYATAVDLGCRIGLPPDA